LGTGVDEEINNAIDDFNGCGCANQGVGLCEAMGKRARYVVVPKFCAVAGAKHGEGIFVAAAASAGDGGAEIEEGVSLVGNGCDVPRLEEDPEAAAESDEYDEGGQPDEEQAARGMAQTVQPLFEHGHVSSGVRTGCQVKKLYSNYAQRSVLLSLAACGGLVGAG
jgi:hypothetical protein